MNTILVPIDFSESSEKALKAAKAISDKTGAELAIMHTSQFSDSGIAVPMTESTFQIFSELEDSYKQQLEEYVAGVQAEGYHGYGIWESDAVQAAILRQATETNADLIVVGRKGNGTLIDKLISSSSARIALEAPCPILVVPPQATVTEFKKVVYATRFDPLEAKILYQIEALIKQLGAKLSVININPIQQLMGNADKQHMLRIIQELDTSDMEVVIAQDMNFIEGIDRYCSQQGADLLIVSTRERRFFEKYITNLSIIKRLVAETRLPLLVYHIK